MKTLERDLTKLINELKKEGVTVIIEDAKEDIQKTIVAGCRGGGGGSCSGACGQGGGGGCRIAEKTGDKFMAKAA
ncbi:MAG: hypothetical protein WC872_03465 [Candidatus Absconditabacterales bacterium]